MKRLAVIPARGGSTRLKDKNTHPLAGKPLIRWITEAVVGSQCFDKVLVSTDSDSIFEAVADLDIGRHHRPDEHATTKATALNAMLNLMENCEEKYDIFSYFLPTCPFISAQDIIKGANSFEDGVDSVLSMTEIPETIQLACVMKEGWVLPVFDNLEAGLTNSKFIKKYYKPSGGFHMARWDKLLQNRNFFKGNVKGVLIPRERSIDIDDINDIKFAENMLTRRST